MSKNGRIILLASLVILLIVFTIAGFYAWNNIPIFGLNSDRNDINKNNSSSSTTEAYTELLNKKIEVPEKYRVGAFKTDRNLNLPKDFTISVFAGGMVNTRSLTFNDKDEMYVTDMSAGKVFYIPDSDSDGIADDVIEVTGSLRSPHGIIFFQNDLYVAEETQVFVLKNIDGKNFSEKKVIISNLPTGGHFSRSLAVGPDSKLYLSIGSSCNLCIEQDARRAAITRYNLDGTGEEIYATGLRNSVGIIFQEDELWSVDNGRDLIGDDLPPEEVNVITEKGKNYGWPYCYGKGINNPEYPDKVEFCKTQTTFPTYEMQAHSAALGLAFVQGENFPESFENQLIVPFHGSWNRTTPTGFKVVRINSNSADSQPVNFITGWLESNGQAWGRPVDVKFDSNGKLYLTDDRAGVVYLIKKN